ncbi:MAG: SAM-dependent methyltransferase [Anaerolineales bacterium]|nr:SAM-dependent methyltransferase [Anaerolineales bacterium]
MSQSPEPISLAAPAYWAAAVRAGEQNHPQCLFEDPWAAALAGDEGFAWIEQRTPDSVVPMVIRTRYFDDFLQRVIYAHDVRQVVLLGAGMDTRACRLEWPANMRLFELDQPTVLRYKAQVLAEMGDECGCPRWNGLPTHVEVDLTGLWQAKLIDSGFDSAQPACWLLEGFLFYLPTPNITRLLDEITALSVAGSWIGFDVINSAMLTHPLTQRWVQMQADAGVPWIGVLDDPEEFLERRGWDVSITQAGAVDAHYKRWPFPILPVKMPGVPHNWFVTAEKT